MIPINLASLKGKAPDHPDSIAWKNAVVFMSDEELSDYLVVWERIQQFEICSIIRDEINKRKE